MKSLAKRLTLICSASIVVVTSVVASELEPSIESFKDVEEHDAQYFFLPELPQEGQALNLRKSSHTPLASNAYYETCKAKKRNELYELTAIFNDKLQMFLSSFNDEPHFQMAEKKEDKESVPLDKKVTL